MLDGKTIIVVAADQGLRRSVAFALEVEGYYTESYDSVQKSEASCREALCAIVDDDILRTEPQAAAQFLSNRGAGPYCWLMACRPFSDVWTTRH
ncbi:histidine kinase (plasmid) [Sinorhizobium meliloti]|nr:histidine kinase [Sinorhizobium meliloti]